MNGVAQLGYLGFEVKDLEAWEEFSTNILGLEIVNRAADGSFGLRMDSHQQRFFITQGEANDLVVAGWQVADQTALDALVKRLEEGGTQVTLGSEEDAKARMVQALVKFNDPAGNPFEVFYGAEKAESTFESKRVQQGFIAEEQGLGHVVVHANDQAQSGAFYENILGFKHSDKIQCEFFGHDVDLSFMHANPRHHSLAFGKQHKKRIHHFMLEVISMDDVGLCYDRCIRGGVPIMNTLGRHPNDRMFSFYAMTPSGFQFEFGWGGRQIDDENWETTTYDCISEWGHHPPMMLAPKKPKKAPPA
jgi:2,3-dihydroxybiphenyl 1,2-dioxygenase